MMRYGLPPMMSTAMRHFATAAVISINTALAVAQQSGPAAPGSVPFTSPAIDHTIYRDGEVRRSAETFAAWQLVCDEIARLRQRFCSLRTIARDASGAPVAALTVSTGEDGRPAALLRVPDHIAAGTTVDVLLRAPETAHPATAHTPSKRQSGSGRSETDRPSRLRPAACSDGACTLVWSLTAPQITALNSNAGLWLRYTAVLPLGELTNPALTLDRTTRAISASIDAAGFAAAVEASLHFRK